MEKWVIIGSGGFVEGSLLPNLREGLVEGIITRQPLKSIGLAKSYNLKIYPDLKIAKKDRCTACYICSPNWTHLDWIKKVLKENLRAISEKPLVVNEEQFEDLKKIKSNDWYGAMIKRAHPFLKNFKNKKKIVFYSHSKSLNSSDYLDSRKGGLLFIELIHYVDLALLFLQKQRYSLKIEGNRVKGKITFSSKAKKIIIDYDFNSKTSRSSLPFHVDTIKALCQNPKKVIISGKKLIPLYNTLFRIQKKQLSDVNA